MVIGYLFMVLAISLFILSLTVRIAKDGGEESRVWGLWLVEWKWLFSVAILRFDRGSRDAYHSHAFNSISWVIKGGLTEFIYDGGINIYLPSFRPIITTRDTTHMVVGEFEHTWVITFRGPWQKFWTEITPEGETILTHTS